MTTLKKESKIKMSDIRFIVNPLQSVLDNIEAEKSPAYAKALKLNITSLFYDWLDYKIKMKENISYEVTGTTRSGKTSVAISAQMYIAKKRKTGFGLENIRKDQQDFRNFIKPIPIPELTRTQWVVDETRTAIFQSGSMASKYELLDFNNICAILQLSIAWLNPQKFDRSHNSQYSLLVWGRDIKHKLTKCLLYDINSSDMFADVPLGYVIIDVSPFVGTKLEKDYIKLKMERVKKQKEAQNTDTAEARKTLAREIGKLPNWKDMKNKKQKKLFVKNIVGDSIPNQVIDDLVELVDIVDYFPNRDKFIKKLRKKK